jgi:hypothetical protein
MVIGFAGVSFVAIFFGLASYTAAYWKLGLMFFGLGLFLGYIAAPATEAVMGALPKARAGIGSAVNTVARMVAGSIGVAALGSALSSVYTARFVREASGLPGLPEEIMGAAKESVGAGVILAGKLPQPLGDTVAHIAKESFMDGWHVMAYIAIALCLLGAFIMLSSMPDRRE